jgi:hypothetical protein
MSCTRYIHVADAVVLRATDEVARVTLALLAGKVVTTAVTCRGGCSYSLAASTHQRLPAMAVGPDDRPRCHLANVIGTRLELCRSTGIRVTLIHTGRFGRRGLSESRWSSFAYLVITFAALTWVRRSFFFSIGILKVSGTDFGLPRD